MKSSATTAIHCEITFVFNSTKECQDFLSVVDRFAPTVHRKGGKLIDFKAPKLPQTKRCARPECTTEFKTTRKKQKYCSSSCRDIDAQHRGRVKNSFIGDEDEFSCDPLPEKAPRERTV